MHIKSSFLILPIMIYGLLIISSCRKNNIMQRPQSSTKSIDTFLLKQSDNGFLFETDTMGIIEKDTIKLFLPGGTNVSQLIPTIGFTGKSVLPASGVARDFTNPVKYTVTDSSEGTKNYIVEVILTYRNELLVNSARVFALDLGTGVARWINEADWKISITSSVATANGLVYTGSSDGMFYAIDAINGKTKWSQKLANSFFYSPVIANGVVYAGCGDGRIYAIDAVSGTRKWTTSLGTYGVFTTPLVANNILYIQCNNNLYAINASNGNQIWMSSALVNMFSSPALANGTVYIGGNDSSLYAIDAATGNTNWNTKTGGISTSPVIATNIIYIGSTNDSLYAIDALTGNKKWVAYVN